MKFIYLLLSLLLALIIIGVIASSSQKSASQSVESGGLPELNASTLLVGQIAFNAVFDDGNYSDKEGIVLYLREDESNQIYQVTSDLNGLFYLKDMPKGVYELTKFEFKKTLSKYSMFYALSISLFFEIQNSHANNLGLIEWNFDKEHIIKRDKDYFMTKLEFTTQHNVGDMEWLETSMSPNAPFSTKRSVESSGEWDIAHLDTARGVTYQSAVEKDVILEINKLRSNPQKYAELYIKPRLQYFNGNTYKEPDKLPIPTKEGIKAVEECYAALMKTPSAPLLSPNRGLSRAAEDHVKDQAKNGGVGHDGSDGSSPYERVKRHGEVRASTGENIAYGPSTAKEIVVGLLIDDGVPSRGHRESVTNQNFEQIGVSTGNHSKYGVMCVIELTKDFRSIR